MLAQFAVLLLLQAPTAPADPRQSAAPACAVSEDPTYGWTIENPVQIGGGALYVAARQRRYLDALRGPSGQPIRHTRIGTVSPDPKALVLIDKYEVTYDGLDKPIHLYLDAYHFWEPRAPRGFTCGQPIQLQPLLDAFKASEDLVATALEQGASREFQPIPLDVAGGQAHGAIWDGFRTLAVASRAAAAKGKTLGPEAARERGSVIVAYPLTCGDRTMAPVNIELVPSGGPLLSRMGGLARGESLEKLLPGVQVPAGAIAAQYPLLMLRTSDRVRITYGEAVCPDGATDVVLPLTFTPARPAAFPPPPLPDGADPSQRVLLLQVVIDLDGALRRVSYVGGPEKLRQAALEVAGSWRAEPARINGAPVPSVTLVGLQFK